MELRHLRYVVQLADDLHFARAARHLGISQPPLSQQIRALEDELDVRLFDRSSRRVTLTTAGALFVEEARRTLEQAARAATVAKRAAAGELGQLRIGFNASAPFIPRIAAAIHDYRETYPDVHLSLTEIAGSVQVTAVDEGSLDIGFLRSASPPTLPAALASSLLLEERLFVAMRPDHPFSMLDGVNLADLLDKPMVVYASDRSGGFTEDVFSLMRRAGVEPRIAQSVLEVSTLLGIVAAGVGIAVVAESLCALQSPGIAYRRVLDDGTTTSMWLVRRQEDGSRPVRNFLDIIAPAA